jgi:hypothetical protein
MGDGPAIVHDWSLVRWMGPWTKEEMVDFILEIEARVARGGTQPSELRPRLPRLSLVKKDG